MFKKDFVKISDSLLVCRMLGEMKQVPLAEIKWIEVNYSIKNTVYAAWTVSAGNDIIMWDNETSGAKEIVYELERHLEGFDLAKINAHVRAGPVEGIVTVWPEIVQNKLENDDDRAQESLSNKLSNAKLQEIYDGLRKIRAVREWQHAHRSHFTLAIIALLLVVKYSTALLLVASLPIVWYGYMRVYLQKCPRCGRLFHSLFCISDTYHSWTIWSDSNKCNNCGLKMSELPELKSGSAYKKPRSIFG